MSEQRTLGDIATDTLRCVLEHDKNACLIGNVRAYELALLAADVIEYYSSACPCCGAEPWVNIDCPICVVVSGLREQHGEDE